MYLQKRLFASETDAGTDNGTTWIDIFPSKQATFYSNSLFLVLNFFFMFFFITQARFGSNATEATKGDGKD